MQIVLSRSMSDNFQLRVVDKVVRKGPTSFYFENM